MMHNLVLTFGDWEIFGDWAIWRFLLGGLWVALRIAAYAIALSIVIGVIMAVGRLAPSRPVRWVATTYVEGFRATPLLLLLFFVFFGAARVDLSWLRHIPEGSRLVSINGQLEPVPSAVIALTLYNSAVVAEIMRAGINSISSGIMEAARDLG